MNELILTCQFLPLLGFLLIFVSARNEKKIATISFWTSHAMGLSIVALLVIWANAGFPNYEYAWFTLYETDNYHFPLCFISIG
jgi:NADH-quinone oxidoreductase subunit L